MNFANYGGVQVILIVIPLENDVLMSCQLGDHGYVRKEIQFEDKEFLVADDRMHEILY